MSSIAKKRRLLLIGWDAADWNFITPLLDAGRMPNLQRLADRGVVGNLASLQPMLSPILWTSIATGKYGDTHGICSFLEPQADGLALRPVSSTSRTVKALWNITTQSGLKSHAIGWYASHPAEPISGVCVSDQFLHFDPAKLPDWPMPPEAVHPPALRDEISQFRIRPVELTATDILPFIPQLAQIHSAADDRPAKLARTIVRASSFHAVATHILESQPWDFLSVYYDAIDTAGHTFMPFHPPAVHGVDPRDAQLYGRVMTTMYEFHDAMLGRLVELAGDDATVMLVSDHGFHCDQRRPADARDSADEAERAAKWHRALGVFAMAGPGVRADERVYGATLLDIAPTALSVLGIPPGADMPGKVLESAFVETPSRKRVDSWESIRDSDAGLHPPDLRVDPIAAAESVRQLVDLGYMSEADASGSDAGLIRRVIDERDFNLAVIFLSSNRPVRAAEILERLHQAAPTNARYRSALARALIGSERPERAIALLEADAQQSSNPEAQLLIAQACHAAGNRERALQLARENAELAPAALNLAWGILARELRELPLAERYLERAVAADPQRAEALYFLAATRLDSGDFASAEALALRTVAAFHGFPAAHHLIAAARAATARHAEALRALDVALELDQTFRPAHELGIAICEKIGDLHRATRHRRALDGHPYMST